MNATETWTQLSQRMVPTVRTALLESFLPFWNRAFDAVNGGFFTCWNNAGTELVSRDKYTWSQGRCVWVWSRLAELVSRGLIPGDRADYFKKAELTRAFLEKHAFLPNGDCAFLLSEVGVMKEPVAGRGFATSIYADCFVLMGFAEYARVFRATGALAQALTLFDRIETRIAAGNFPTAPQPIPDGYIAYAIAMITLNVALVVSEACDELADPRASELRQRCRSGVDNIFSTYVSADGGLSELRALKPNQPENLLTRHINPGHALEGLWIILTIARREGRTDWIKQAQWCIHFAFQRGWDSSYGGLLHYADRAGGPPQGSTSSSRTPYEESLQNGWDKKLWWVHSEAAYTGLLGFNLTGDTEIATQASRIFDYSFGVFPNPDRAIGEWIQIRNRSGAPVDAVVALPVKDPYHVLRTFILTLELFAQSAHEAGSPRPPSRAPQI